MKTLKFNTVLFNNMVNQNTINIDGLVITDNIHDGEYIAVVEQIDGDITGRYEMYVVKKIHGNTWLNQLTRQLTLNV